MCETIHFIFISHHLYVNINSEFSPPTRLQELEDQYRKEREEASNLLEQQRLVSGNTNPGLHHFISWLNHSNPCLRTTRANWKLFRSKWSLGTWNLPRKRRSQKRKVRMTFSKKYTVREPVKVMSSRPTSVWILQCHGQCVRRNWLCGHLENGVSISSPRWEINSGATPSSSRRPMLSVWSWRKRHAFSSCWVAVI